MFQTIVDCPYRGYPVPDQCVMGREGSNGRPVGRKPEPCGRRAAAYFLYEMLDEPSDRVAVQGMCLPCLMELHEQDPEWLEKQRDNRTLVIHLGRLGGG